MDELAFNIASVINNEHLDATFKVLRVMRFEKFCTSAKQPSVVDSSLRHAKVDNLCVEIVAMYKKELKLKERILSDLLRSTYSSNSSPLIRTDGRNDTDGSIAMNIITVRSSAWLYQPYIDEGRCKVIHDGLQFEFE